VKKVKDALIASVALGVLLALWKPLVGLVTGIIFLCLELYWSHRNDDDRNEDM